MKRITVSELLRETGGVLLSGDAETFVENVSTDSRVIPENALFVPIIGEKMDGHDFIASALKNGAKAVFTSRKAIPSVYSENGAETPYENAALILVPDTLKALQAVGKLARKKLSLPAIGVTGSVGKTTTREMVSAALSGGKKVYKTDKNYNNKIGVPLTLCEMSDDYDIAVLELGLNVRDELGTISALSDIETAMITNIGVAHIEYYGTKDEICKEKFTVTRGFWPENPAKKMLFLNGDDPYLMKYKDLSGFPYRTYAVESDKADYYARDVRFENGRTVFTLYKAGTRLLELTLSVLGRHNVLNAVGAMAVADYYQVDLQKAAESLGKFTGFKHRLERFEKDGVMLIDDTYNASPASMIAGVNVLSEMNYGDGKGSRIAVLGDMFELGEASEHYHREVGEAIVKERFDRLLLIGENANKLGETYREAGGTASVSEFSDNDTLLRALKEMLKPGDIVYFKASHGMHLSDAVEALLQ